VSVSNDVHVIPEHPEDPCVVAGRVEATNNWFGYLGIFRLRRSSSTTNFGVSSAVSTPSTPARLYFRIVYPIVNGGKNVPVSLLFYLGEQVRSLNVRMNCFQRLQLVDQRGPQVIRLDPSIAQSGCINRTRTATDFVGGGRVRGGRSGSGTAGDGAEWTTVVDCRGGRLLRSNVERQWNVAVSSCGSPRGLVLSYTLVVYGHVGRCPSNPSLSGAKASSVFDKGALFLVTLWSLEIMRLETLRLS
jgi:hypothetical protein